MDGLFLEITDIVIEALEVLLNHILYLRDVYPTQIFKKRRIYNTPVYISIYPPLNSYLYNVLKSARELLKNNELRCLEAKLYKEDSANYEVYRFMIANPIAFNKEKQDEFLIDFEEQIRASLYLMAERLKLLPKLPNDARFKVLLQTTQAAFVKFSQNPHHQNFPWICSNCVDRPTSKQEEISLLPLTSIKSLNISLMADIVR
uniref:HORMA domain-containing protein n=1 Tax=Glossina morsitans morsitans TaxID=37546 RepID=A0A1B0GDF1_GLOMM